MVNLFENIAIIGAGGAIGGALVHHYAMQPSVKKVFAFSRRIQCFQADSVVERAIDYYDESSLAAAAETIDVPDGIDLIIVTTGVLHTDDVMPEKSLNDLSMHKFETIFKIDMVIPALITKHFVSKLHKSRSSVLAILTARVGSVTDNRLGGWYAYRSAKSALNMFIKNTAIEISRRHKHQIVVGVHPGTVDSPLSKPFQANLDPSKVFSPALSAQYVDQVLVQLSEGDAGKILAWDGQIILP